MRHALIALPLSVLGLIGCAQGGFDWSANALPPPSVVELAQRQTTVQSAPLRIIVQFRQPVAANDPAVVASLQTQAQGVVQFLSSVSGDTQVFSLLIPAGQDAAQTLQRLAAMPSVKRVEPDENVKPHPLR